MEASTELRSAMSAIVLDNVTVEYHRGQKALAGVSARIPTDGITVLVGRSGSGKSTLLRLLSGLANHDSGTLRMPPVAVRRSNDRPQIGMVFQQFVLFPHWNVSRNIGFSVRRLPDREARIRMAAEMAHVEHLLDRRPQELSGGEQQRVALARVLAARPTLALLDEPLAHVDMPLRYTLQESLRQWQRENQNTVVYVTHDMSEAVRLADQLIVIDGGRVVQCGAPGDVCRAPRHPATKRLVESLHAADMLPRSRPLRERPKATHH